MLDDEVEEGVDRMQATTIESHLAERLAYHGFVGTRDDLGVEEVAVPHPDTELLLVVFAEPPSIVFVLNQCVSFDVVAQMQSGCARTEFLKDHQVDAVGVHLERHG